MGLKTVNLVSFTLFDIHNRVNVSVHASADLDFPTGTIQPVDDTVLRDALESRCFWVVRAGTSCLEVQVSIDGKRLTSINQEPIMKIIATSLQDLPLWSQLEMLANIEMPEFDMFGEKATGVHLMLAHGVSTDMRNQGVVPVDVLSDFRPPNSMLCVSFEALRVSLHFSKHDTYSKRAKVRSIDKQRFDAGANKTSASYDRYDLFASDYIYPGKIEIQSADAKSTNSTSGCIHNYDALDGLEESRSISFHATNFSAQIPQIRESMNNISETFSILENMDEGEEDALLLGGDIPVQYSTHLPIMDDTLKGPRVGSKRNIDEAELVINACIKGEDTLPLTQSAFYTLVAGYDSRHKSLRDITVKKPQPEVSLSEMVPVLWSPGFKSIVNRNAQYLPRISRTICSSWVRNAQSPTLRNTLRKLSESIPTPYHSNTNINLGDAGTTGRLSAVVDTRLWVLMQRKLFDPTASRRLELPARDNEDGLKRVSSPKKLRSNSLNEESSDFQDDEFLLEEVDSHFWRDLDKDRSVSDIDSDVDLLTEIMNQEQDTIEHETEEILLSMNDSLPSRLPSCSDYKDRKVSTERFIDLDDEGMPSQELDDEQMLLRDNSQTGLTCLSISSPTNKDIYGSTAMPNSDSSTEFEVDSPLLLEQDDINCAETGLRSWLEEDDAMLL